MMTARRRKRWPAGAWMKLRNGKLLAGQMQARGVSQYRLAEYVGCTRGFVSHLVAERKTTCTPALAERISEVLGVDLELLFTPSVSPNERTTSSSKRRNAA